MKKVLVTGANGQLGQCLRDIAGDYPDCEFMFTSREELPIEDEVKLTSFFAKNAIDYCINAAAYTNVEKAESEETTAFRTNAEAVRTLAEKCREHRVTLVHVSTDYVFDGSKETPYSEEDETGPINVYGASKLKGEQYINEIGGACFIVRTSWLYSQYGHNFMKTVLRFASEEKPLTVTEEQQGTPTNANDLARAIMEIVSSGSKAYGTYHFSNEGSTSWFEFARAILRHSGQNEHMNLVQPGHYRTFAQRPKNSVLDKTRFKNTFAWEIPHWETSLQSLLQRTNN